LYKLCCLPSHIFLTLFFYVLSFSAFDFSPSSVVTLGSSLYFHYFLYLLFLLFPFSSSNTFYLHSVSPFFIVILVDFPSLFPSPVNVHYFFTRRIAFQFFIRSSIPCLNYVLFFPRVHPSALAIYISAVAVLSFIATRTGIRIS
jgi:hypothetical protein